MAWILVLIICFTALTLVGCAQESAAGGTTATAENGYTVFAKIEEINGTTLLVRGISEGFTGEYTLSTENAIICAPNDTKILVKLEVGDTVAITYSGLIMESYPAILAEVTKITKATE